MKTSRIPAFLATVSLFVLTVCIGCSGGLTDEVHPQTQVTKSDDAPKSHEPGEIGTYNGSDQLENRALNEIAIDVLPCGEEGASRAFALLVYSLTDNNLEVFSYDRYSVEWYGFDGSLLSEEHMLECVAGGNYFVHVLDDITGAEGRASISL